VFLFQETIDNVKQNIMNVLVHVAQGRMHIVKDWYLITSNQKYVQWWSIAQSVVVILSAVTQVFMLRRLFRTSTRTPTSKPRA